MLGRGRLALAAALVIGAGATTGAIPPAPVVVQHQPRKAKRNLFGGGYTFMAPRLFGHKGAGIGMAQQKRAAKKARNVKRHRTSLRR